MLQKANEKVETSYPEPPEFIAQGDRVLVVGFATGKIKATNKTFKDHWVFDITVRNGKLTRSGSILTRKHWRGPPKRPRAPGTVETTERYLGSRQRIVHAVNDKLGIEPDAPPG